MLDIPVLLAVITQPILGIILYIILTRRSENSKIKISDLIISMFHSPQMFLQEVGSLVFAGTSGLFYYLFKTFELDILLYLLTLSLVFMFSSVIMRVIPFTAIIPTGTIFTLAFMMHPGLSTNVIIVLILFILFVINLFMWFDGTWESLFELDTYIIFEDFIGAFYPIFPLIFVIVTCFY